MGQSTPILSANATKQLIVEILSNEWPLPARAIYNKLIKRHQLSVTYQAVHKALKEMCAQNIVVKDGKGYKIHSGWIKQINEFGGKIKTEYENPAKPKAAFEYTFNSLFEAYMAFFLPELEKNLSENGNNIACFHDVHMWNCLPVRSEEETRLRAVTDKTKIYALAKSSNKFDEIMKKYWESFGIKVRTGFGCTSNFGVVVIGNKIYYLHYPQDLLESMQNIYSTIDEPSDIDIAKLNRDIIYKSCKIYVVVNKNKSVADLIRGWTVKQFNQGQ